MKQSEKLDIILRYLYERKDDNREYSIADILASSGHLTREVIVTKGGYAYIFLSNENSTQVDVYFDDLTVVHAKSPVIQMDDYYPFGLTFNSYQRENSLDQKYLYNGHEKQDELGLGWLDYGSRMYIPEIGKFNRPDIFSALNSSQTSYGYAGNNPINSIDMGGNFQFPVEFRQQYPRVTAYLEKMLPHLQNNQAVVNKISEHTRLSKDIIKRDFQNGSGPEIIARDLGDPYGRNMVIGRLDMNSKTVLDQLEAGLATNGDPQYQEFTDTYIFFIIVTILHEYVHDASKRTKYRLPLGMKSGYDEGSNWTEDTFGRYIQNPTEKIAAENKPSNPKLDETAQSYLRSTPRNSDLFIGIFFITSPTNGNGNNGNQKKKPDADRERKKKTGS